MIPKISIIVPVYNVELYLEKCVDSILAQTFTDFQLILVNDGSTDNSGEICNDFARRDDRILAIHRGNEGVSSAKNIGLNLARSEYIIFVDADDWIERPMLDILYTSMVLNSVELAVSGTIVDYISCLNKSKIYQCDLEGRYNLYNGCDIFSELSNNNLLNFCHGKMFKKSIIDQMHLRFLENVTLAEDTLFLISYLQNSCNIYMNRGNFYHYVQHSSSSLAYKYRSDKYEILTKIIGEFKNLFVKFNVYNGKLEGYLMDRYGVIVIGTIRDFSRKECKLSFVGRVKYLRYIFQDIRFDSWHKKIDFKKYDSKLGIVANLNNSLLCIIYVIICSTRYNVLCKLKVARTL